MKRRVRKIANFFAFNLLFFALYLNFIHKDKTGIAGGETTLVKSDAFSGTVLVDNPEQYLDKKNESATMVNTPGSAEKNSNTEGAALKLTIN